jgi:hypothetical protein
MARTNSPEEVKLIDVISTRKGILLLGRVDKEPLSISPGTSQVSEADWKEIRKQENVKLAIAAGELSAPNVA